MVSFKKSYDYYLDILLFNVLQRIDVSERNNVNKGQGKERERENKMKKEKKNKWEGGKRTINKGDTENEQKRHT